jgi:hypothetical protein
MQAHPFLLQQNRVHIISVPSAYLGPVCSSFLPSSSRSILTLSQLVLQYFHILLVRCLKSYWIRTHPSQHHLLPPSCRSPGSICPPRISTPCWTGWTLCLPAPFQMQPPDVIHPDIQANQVHNIANTLTPARLMVIDNIGRNG